MSCFSVLHSQVATLLSVPQEILLLQHNVFREYAKIAVGPDFIHTFPSFLILIAAILMFWRNPPSSGKLMDVVGATFYRIFQVSVSWLAINTLLWLWLILQGILYCSVWMYWSYESEYRDVSYPWWQRVWSSYYPAPVQPPVMSADFISWIITMFIAIIMLGCATSTDYVRILGNEILKKFRDTLAMVNSCIKWSWNRMQKIFVTFKTNEAMDDNDSSICEQCRSDILSDANSAGQGDIHQISYGTNWVSPNFPTFREAQRKISMKSFHTVAAVNDVQDFDKFPAKQIRHRRGCHTAIPSNSSEQSSGR